MLINIAYAMGQMPEGQKPGGISMLFQFMPFILIFLIFYFLLIRPQTKKAKEHRQMLDNLKKGDKVTTQGGIYGIVENLDANIITLKIAENVKIKVSRSAIATLRND